MNSAGEEELEVTRPRTLSDGGGCLYSAPCSSYVHTKQPAKMRTPSPPAPEEAHHEDRRGQQKVAFYFAPEEDEPLVPDVRDSSGSEEAEGDGPSPEKASPARNPMFRKSISMMQTKNVAVSIPRFKNLTTTWEEVEQLENGLGEQIVDEVIWEMPFRWDSDMVMEFEVLSGPRDTAG